MSETLARPRRARMQSPLGPIDLWAQHDALVRLDFVEPNAPVGEQWILHQFKQEWIEASDDRLLHEAIKQLQDYFAGTRTRFDLPIAFHGTPFQQSVWRAVYEVPWGETRTYGAIAASLGKPAAVRAVGAANGANPLSIIVPCHRLIGSDGALHGYGGGLERKKRLLALEQGHAA